MMIDFSSPESSAALLAVLVLGLSQWLKETLGIADKQAAIASAIVGALAGIVWYSAWYPLIAEPSAILGIVASMLAFALVPSGLYKFTRSVADRVNGCACD